MPSDEQNRSKESKRPKRRINWELSYYEQVGNRIYKRYTPFALISTIIFGLLALIVLIIRHNPPPLHHNRLIIAFWLS